VAPHQVQVAYVDASIEADGAPSQPLVLVVEISGRWHTPLPPDIDFGNVVINTPSQQVFIPSESSALVREWLSSSNPAFTLDNITAIPVNGGGWKLTFWPQFSNLGPQETTLTFGTPAYGVDCPPNSIKARGVAVLP